MNFHRSFYEWHENGSKIGKRMGKMPKWMMTLFKLTQHAVLIDVSEADSFNRQMAFYPLTTLCATYKEKDSWYTEGKQRTSYLFQMPCKNKGRGLYRHMTNSYSPRTVAFLKQTRNVGGITNFTYWWFGFSFFSSWSVEQSNSYLSRVADQSGNLWHFFEHKDWIYELLMTHTHTIWMEFRRIYKKYDQSQSFDGLSSSFFWSNSIVKIKNTCPVKTSFIRFYRFWPGHAKMIDSHVNSVS